MNELYVGIDMGGSFTKGGLVSDGKIIISSRVPTKIGSLASVFFVIDEILKNVKIGEIRGIGIAIAGMVTKQRVLLSASNLKLEKTNIAEMAEGKYKIPVKIGNDVSCFALAEAAASGLDNLVFLALGTGVNIGVISNGKLFSGADGASIEYGHTCFESVSGNPCLCGLAGCVEQFISGKALMLLGEKNHIAAEKPEEVFAASKEIADTFLTNLGIVLVNIANSYRPEKIFIGGGLAAMIKPYIGNLNRELKRKNYGYKNAPAVTVEISKLSNDGAVLGAVNLFKD